MRADATAIEEMSPEQALAMIERMQREAAPAPVPAPAAAIAGAAPVARAPAPPARRARLEVALEDALTQLVMDVLKLEPGDFSPTRSLMDYGMDSISSTEIGNRFTARFDIVIPPTVFFEFQDLRGLTRYLLKNHEADVRRVLDIHGDDSVDVAPVPEAAPVRAVAPAAQPVVARPAAPAAVPVTAPAP
ncbi:MAG: acyl carrier protein, partial [Gammaproteobacteria bacterium]|nr:acyl carrier protein [Gammaproteobacteria bacterium]